MEIALFVLFATTCLSTGTVFGLLKPRKSSEPKQITSKKKIERHTLVETYIGQNNRYIMQWGYRCSCGSESIVIKGDDPFKKTSEADAVAVWKKHHDLRIVADSIGTPESLEAERIKEEFEAFKNNCICKEL